MRARKIISLFLACAMLLALLPAAMAQTPAQAIDSAVPFRVEPMMAGDYALRYDGTVWRVVQRERTFIPQWDSYTYTRLNKATQVPDLSNIVAIAGSEWNHMLALRHDGTVWTWNLDRNANNIRVGNITQPIPANRAQPIQVPWITDVTTLYANGTIRRVDDTRWQFFIYLDGAHNYTLQEVWEDTWTGTWGSASPVDSGWTSSSGLWLLDDGSVFERHWNDTNPVSSFLSFPDRAAAMSVVTCHALILLEDGTVWATAFRPTLNDEWWCEYCHEWHVNYAYSSFWREFGPNREPQFGDIIQVPGLTNVSSIYAVDTSWGNETALSVALRADGTVWAWGPNLIWSDPGNSDMRFLRPVQVSGLTGITQVVAASDWAFWVLDDSGIIWDVMHTSTGWHSRQIANNISFALNQNFVVHSDGTLRVWGREVLHPEWGTSWESGFHTTTMPNGQPFNILPRRDTPNSWAVTYMNDAREIGLIDGPLPDGVLYRDGAPRWYIAELLAAFMEVYTSNTLAQIEVDFVIRGGEISNVTFPDVPDSHPQYTQIMALARLGILTGGEFGGVFGFNPNGTLTRAQAAVGLMNMMRALGYQTTGFSDAADFADWHIGGGQGGIQSWAREPVSFLYYHSIMTSTASAGTPPGTPAFIFNPNFAFQTQQLIIAMVRMLDVDWPVPPPPEGFPQMSITLPDRRLTADERAAWIAKYNAMGGAFAFELEVVQIVNEIRADHELIAVEIDASLMHAARFYAQTVAQFPGAGHNVGPYAEPDATHGASANIAAAFGARLRWNGGNFAWGSHLGMTAETLVNLWMNSPGHQRYILSPEHRFIGAGAHVGASGSGVYHYLFLSEQPSI
ncbi:MAG: S-layer homology domain-containing protein [Oscillospiraceae bacterium]|nr:S-layer homology domain-containing protein [Oscillospiraceae bacterium]